MLAEDTPTIRYVSARTGMKKVVAAGEDFHTSFDAFARQRTALVQTLTSLKAAGWSRSAIFTGQPGWTPTVFDLAQGIAGHEHSHFEQIAAAAR